MRPIEASQLAVCIILALSACTPRADRADIRIKGSEAGRVHFEIGEVRSKLATDAVDEAVRVNPRKVYVHICLATTPGERIASWRRS